MTHPILIGVALLTWAGLAAAQSPAAGARTPAVKPAAAATERCQHSADPRRPATLCVPAPAAAKTRGFDEPGVERFYKQPKGVALSPGTPSPIRLNGPTPLIVPTTRTSEDDFNQASRCAAKRRDFQRASLDKRSKRFDDMREECDRTPPASAPAGIPNNSR